MAKHNIITALIDQQIGCSPLITSDVTIKRLKCIREVYCSNFPFRRLQHTITEFPRPNQEVRCKFAHFKGYEEFVALARCRNFNGTLSIINTENQANSRNYRFSNNVYAMEWTNENMHILLACYKRTYVYDLNKGSFQCIKKFYDHQQIHCLAMGEASTYVSGGQEGLILLHDLRLDDNPQMTISNFREANSTKKFLNFEPQAINDLVFQNEYNLISSDSHGWCIKIWDLRKHSNNIHPSGNPKYVIKNSGEEPTSTNLYNCLLVDKERHRLYSSYIDNNIYCFNLLNYSSEPVMYYTGDNNNRLCYDIRASLSKDGNYLLSGSIDHNAYVWNVKESWPFVKLKGLTSKVISSSWCQNTYNDMLITCSEDYNYNIWRLLPEAQEECTYIKEAEVIPDSLRNTQSDFNWMKK